MLMISESMKELAYEKSAWGSEMELEKLAEVRGVFSRVTSSSLVTGKVRNVFFKVMSPLAVPLIKNLGVGSPLPSRPCPCHPVWRDPFFQVRDKG